MVSVTTNRPDFLNDISEEIRAFLGLVEIEPADAYTAPDSPDDISLSVHLYPCETGYRVEGKCIGLGQDTPVTFEESHSEQSDDPLLKKRYEKRMVKIAAYRMMRELTGRNLPWGSLTGIRPTKLLRDLIYTEGAQEAERIMQERFDVTKEKFALAKTIVSVQEEIIRSATDRDIDVYIGIPFCKTRCLYCSFASEVLGKTGDKLAAYLEALKYDIQQGAQIVKQGGYRVRSMYIGGGTPTVLNAAQLRDLISFALSCYGGYGSEFTVEAGRPDTLDSEKLQVLYDAGVNRISINPQSMHAPTLKNIGRNHTPEQICETFADARRIGFDAINMDIIAGLPGEGIEEMAHTLTQIAQMKPDNLTVHTLAIKRSSRLKEHLDEYPLPSMEVVQDMIALAAEQARQMGMHPYYMYRQKYMNGNLENVGYAAKGKDCIYNIDMMEEITHIMAHGAGAISKKIFPRETRLERIPNPKDITTYAEKLDVIQKQKRELFFSE